MYENKGTMSLISIRKVEVEDINIQLMEGLSHVLTYLEPKNFEDCLKWWQLWFSDKIPGDKLTIIAENQNIIIGVARFWRSPYCRDKWLIEGLEVIPPQRNKGIGKSIINEGIRMLQKTTDESIFVHIGNKNITSIKLHEGLGFKKISNGSINSYGNFRDQVDEYLLESLI